MWKWLVAFGWCSWLMADTMSTTIVRFENNPMIRPEMLPKDEVVNINGPSLIKAPDWLPNRRGRYYLYFANHRGPHIHLAFADKLDGPWTLSDLEPLSVAEVALINQETLDSHSHVASPDIYVDEKQHRIRMYYHFRLPKLGHRSSIAESTDGMHFVVRPGSIGDPYLRHFVYGNAFYFIDKKGRLIRSDDGLTNFVVGSRQVFQALFDNDTKAYLRHTGLMLAGDRLHIFFSRIGDAPESILKSVMQLSSDWTSWKPLPPRLVVTPETLYEGVDVPIKPSKKGDAKSRMHELRDPAIFLDGDRVYLLYAVAGEYGIAIAELVNL